MAEITTFFAMTRTEKWCLGSKNSSECICFDLRRRSDSFPASAFFLAWEVLKHFVETWCYGAPKLVPGFTFRFWMNRRCNRYENHRKVWSNFLFHWFQSIRSVLEGGHCTWCWGIKILLSVAHWQVLSRQIEVVGSPLSINTQYEIPRPTAETKFDLWIRICE